MLLCFLADGFEEVEAIAIVDVLRRAKVNVVTVGVTGKKVTGAHNITVVSDKTIDEVQMDSSLQGIILPGGMPGTTNLEENDTVQEFIDFANEKNLLISAVCAAPSILGHRGLLKNKSATCFPGFEDSLFEATVVRDAVVRDGNIITGKGAGVALLFAGEIASEFVGKEKADAILKEMQCR